MSGPASVITMDKNTTIEAEAESDDQDSNITDVDESTVQDSQATPLRPQSVTNGKRVSNAYQPELTVSDN